MIQATLKTFFVFALLASGFVADASAQERGADNQDRRARALERFDADGSGTLDATEREALRGEVRKQREERRGQRAQRQPRTQSKEGQGVQRERRRARVRKGVQGREGAQAIRKRLLERFDTNKDGQLNAGERQELRKQLQERRGQGQARGRRGQRGDQGQARGRRGQGRSQGLRGETGRRQPLRR